MENKLEGFKKEAARKAGKVTEGDEGEGQCAA
eukprot:SAG11_NODE_21959_length_415_cov_0.655063_1_plen_31_part_01